MHGDRPGRQIDVQDDLWNRGQKTLPIALLENIDVVAARFENIRQYAERIASVGLNGQSDELMPVVAALGQRVGIGFPNQDPTTPEVIYVVARSNVLE